MAFGEHTYKALREGVIKSITEKFDPDWEVLVLGAWHGFIEDMREDIRVDFSEVDADGRHVTDKEDGEILLAVYLQNEWDIPHLGQKRPLSDILFEFADMDSVEETIRLLNNSIAAFKKKAGVEE